MIVACDVSIDEFLFSSALKVFDCANDELPSKDAADDCRGNDFFSTGLVGLLKKLMLLPPSSALPFTAGLAGLLRQRRDVIRAGRRQSSAALQHSDNFDLLAARVWRAAGGVGGSLQPALENQPPRTLSQ